MMYDDTWFYAPSYEEGIGVRGIRILAWEIFGSWSGDYAAVFQQDDKYGFTVIGYGSCSGCDALEACETEDEYENLVDSIVGGIFWGSAEEVAAKIKNEFDDNNWYRHDEGFTDSIQILLGSMK